MKGSWLLHHNNVPAHTAFSIRQFLAKHSIPTPPQPPYSPDLSSPNIFLFPKLKITVKRGFQTVEDIITNVTNDLKVIPQTSFVQCFQKFKRWWEWCIAAHGDHALSFKWRKILFTDKFQELFGHTSYAYVF
jgi:hypothetical protein